MKKNHTVVSFDRKFHAWSVTDLHWKLSEPTWNDVVFCFPIWNLQIWPPPRTLQIVDLLNPNTDFPLNLRWQKSRGFYVENLYVIECETVEDLMSVLETGQFPCSQIVPFAPKGSKWSAVNVMFTCFCNSILFYQLPIVQADTTDISNTQNWKSQTLKNQKKEFQHNSAVCFIYWKMAVKKNRWRILCFVLDLGGSISIFIQSWNDRIRGITHKPYRASEESLSYLNCLFFQKEISVIRELVQSNDPSLQVLFKNFLMHLRLWSHNNCPKT